MFQEKNEGQTHYFGDGCKPAHEPINVICITCNSGRGNGYCGKHSTSGYPYINIVEPKEEEYLHGVPCCENGDMDEKHECLSPESWEDELEEEIKKTPEFVFYECYEYSIGEDLKIFINKILAKQKAQLQKEYKEEASKQYAQGQSDAYRIEAEEKTQLLEKINQIPTKNPKRESEEYDKGLKDMKEEIIKIIKN